MLRSPDGLTSFRRIVEMTEVRKHWNTDPRDEGGFVDLLQYSAKDDVLKPTTTLLTGESMILNDIASRVREWKGDWDAVWGNINLRKDIFSAIVDTAAKTGRTDLLEAPFVIASNEMFHIISSVVREETGTLDNRTIFEQWQTWLRSRL